MNWISIWMLFHATISICLTYWQIKAKKREDLNNLSYIIAMCFWARDHCFTFCYPSPYFLISDTHSYEYLLVSDYTSVKQAGYVLSYCKIFHSNQYARKCLMLHYIHEFLFGSIDLHSKENALYAGIHKSTWIV